MTIARWHLLKCNAHLIVSDTCNSWLCAPAESGDPAELAKESSCAMGLLCGQSVWYQNEKCQLAAKLVCNSLVALPCWKSCP